MTETEAQTLHLLKQIDQKLEKLIREFSDESRQHSSGAKQKISYSARAQEIADMTPQSVRQTDTVELLHEDRSR